MKFILCLLFSFFVLAGASFARKPNVILILADDLGYAELGSYGQKKIKTPRLDQLAREGMRFTRHSSGSAVCAPTRCVLMTGLHTGHCRRRDNTAKAMIKELSAKNGRPLVFLEKDDLTVAEALKGAGYVTGGIGKWGLGNPGSDGVPEKQGFDYWYGYLDQVHAHDHFPEEIWDGGRMIQIPENAGKAQRVYVPYEMERKTLSFIREHRDRPFFLYLAYTPPHGAYIIPKTDPTYAMYAGIPGGETVRHYAAMITRTDQTVGKVLDLLQELSIDEDTIVFYTSDNGPNAPFIRAINSAAGLRGSKRMLYEGGIRAAMAVRWPGKVPTGVSSDFIWDMRDVFPTACELAGVEAPDHLDGMSVLPTLLGRQQQSREMHYWEIHSPFHQAVRFGNWKGIRHGTKESMELYDLGADPSETTDLATLHPDIVGRIAQFMDGTRTDSPYFPTVEERPARGGGKKNRKKQ